MRWPTDLQRTLASPLPHLQFLMALSSLNPDNTPTSAPQSSQPFGSTLSSAKSAPQSLSSAGPSSSRPPISEPDAHWKAHGKSKADLLKSWRTAQCTFSIFAPIPQQHTDVQLDRHSQNIYYYGTRSTFFKVLTDDMSNSPYDRHQRRTHIALKRVGPQTERASRWGKRVVYCHSRRVTMMSWALR